MHATCTQYTYFPIKGMASGNLSWKNCSTFSSLLSDAKMSKGMKSVTTKLWSSVFGRPIIMNSFRGQMCR